MNARAGTRIEDDHGATTAEYALMLGLVALAMLSFVTGLSGAMRLVFSSMSDKLR